jgi:homogentisate phytyltransferase/homogentisate geranylgeranyltransferase
MATHLAALVALWVASFRVAPLHPDNPKATLSYPNFYQFIWKLFFLQYLMFPLACWFA